MWWCSVQMARWANTAGRLPAELLQELAGLAKQDVLRFELDYKPTLAFQVIFLLWPACFWPVPARHLWHTFCSSVA